MKTPALKYKLLDYINAHEGWHKKGSLYSIIEEWGYSPESGGRKLRELEQEGKIQVAYYDGRYARGLAKYSALGIEQKPLFTIIERDGERVAIKNI